MFFPHLNSFCLIGSFQFYSQGAFPFAHFIHCLLRYSRLSNFFQVYFIDLTLNVIFLFFLVCVSSLCAFLSFCALESVGFLLVHKDTAFMLSHFFVTASVSQENLCLALGLIEMQHAAASMCVWTRFSYSSFEVYVSDISWRVSYCYCIFIANISISKRGLVVACGFVCFYLRRIFPVTIL